MGRSRVGVGLSNNTRASFRAQAWIRVGVVQPQRTLGVVLRQNALPAHGGPSPSPNNIIAQQPSSDVYRSSYHLRRPRPVARPAVSAIAGARGTTMAD